MPAVQNTIFISYRRQPASFIARAVFQDLRAHGYDVFLDVESINNGQFDSIILNQIAARAHFVLILTPGTLERCGEPGDWLRREIEEAMRLERNIIPLLVNQFEMSAAQPYLTGQLADLGRFNAVNVPHDYFEAAMDKLRTRFLSQPVEVTLHAAPSTDISVVEQKLSDAVAAPSPTEVELSAEEFFQLGQTRFLQKDFGGADSAFSEALRLKPDYGFAYAARSAARQANGDLAAAMADMDEALTHDPHNPDVYFQRADIYREQQNFAQAEADYSETLRLNPNHVFAYLMRAFIHDNHGKHPEALHDYQQFLALGGEKILSGTGIRVEDVKARVLVLQAKAAGNWLGKLFGGS